LSRPSPFFTVLHDLLDRKDAPTVGDLVLAAPGQTDGLLTLLIALPALIPGINVGLAPLGGATLLWMGLQLAFGRVRPNMPARILNLRIHRGRAKEALARLETLLGHLGKGTRRGTINHRWMGLLIAWTAFLLLIPVPLPFGNQLPAVILTLLGAALLEERPAWAWLGALGTLLNTIYFTMSFQLIVHACLSTLRAIQHWIRP